MSTVPVSRSSATVVADAKPAALKKDDITQMKQKFGFNPEETFAVPKETYDIYQSVAKKGADIESEWNSMFAKYKEQYPTEAAEFTRRVEADCPRAGRRPSLRTRPRTRLSEAESCPRRRSTSSPRFFPS